MRHFRISLSLQVVFFAFCALGPVRGADAVATLLENLGPDDEYVFVWVISSNREQELWLDDLSSSTRWRETVGSYPTTTLRAEKNRSFLIQFAIETAPLCLVLDANGREVGRIRVGNVTRDAVGALSSQVQDLLAAADASRRHRNSVAVRDGDVSTLFWLGYFHWSRGERYKAVRWFEEYSALPCEEYGPHSELKTRALYRQGEHALEAGQSQKAAVLFSRALELTRSPETAARCALAHARSLRRLGKPEAAIRSIETQLRSRPSSPLQDRLLFSLGYLYLDLGQREEARKAFAECATSFPDSPYSRKSAHYLRELDAPDVAQPVEDE